MEGVVHEPLILEGCHGKPSLNSQPSSLNFFGRMNDVQLLFVSIGVVAIGVGWWCLSSPESSRLTVARIPRSVGFGRVLMLVDACWSIYLLDKMEIGFLRGAGFGGFLGIFVHHWWLGGLTVYGFVIFYVDHYLGARSIGLFLILVAKPILWICFLHDERVKLVMVVLAYTWIVWGICIVSAPHWLRDAIDFWKKTPERWLLGARAKILFGFVLIALGLMAH